MHRREVAELKLRILATVLGNLLGQSITNHWGGDAPKEGVSCGVGYSLGQARLLTIQCESPAGGDLCCVLTASAAAVIYSYPRGAEGPQELP